MEHSHLPDNNRLSVLAATILLAYALTPFIVIPQANLAIQLPFVVFSFSLSFNTIISILVAGLAAAGMNWLLASHPSMRTGLRANLQHYLLPALTSWVIGVPLGNLPIGPQWWAVFALGGLLLMLVFIGEYIVVDFADARHAPASAGLMVLSFALYLVLCIAIRGAGLRLYLSLPAVSGAIYLVILRTFYLRLGGTWQHGWAIVISLLVAHVALALQYLPVSPLSYGLFLLAPAYSLTSIAISISEGRRWRSFLLEPLVMLAVLVFLGILLG